MAIDLERLLEFQKLLVQFSNVERRLHRKHQNVHVPENDTEHSYNLAMTAWFLVQSFPELNENSVIRCALAHDLVEVHAGDTYIYGSEDELASKTERENHARQQLLREWPDFAELHQAINEYEARQTPEAKFVYALDKIMPIMMIYIHQGYTWEKQHTTAKMLYDSKVHKVALSPEIVPYFNALHQLLLDHPEIIKPT